MVPTGEPRTTGTDLEQATKRDILSWTHYWFTSAHTLAETLLEERGDLLEDLPRRDALSLPLVLAIHTTVRGAEAVLGADAPPLIELRQKFPGLRELRDRLAHFDEYVRGQGRRQVNENALPLPRKEMPRLHHAASTGDGRRTRSPSRSTRATGATDTPSTSERLWKWFVGSSGLRSRTRTTSGTATTAPPAPLVLPLSPGRQHHQTGTARHERSRPPGGRAAPGASGQRCSASSSAICTALRAAPLRRLSLEMNIARPWPSGAERSGRMRPT